MTGVHPYLGFLADAVRAAHAARRPVAIRGGGTKDFYGGAVTGDPLDVRPLSGITSYEPTELVITALAGTPLEHVEAALAERGQHLAFEPPRFGAGGTVGGMVAAGLSGPGRARAGCVRDFLLGVTTLNGRGEFGSFGGQVMKNVAGYDVSRLFAGSMGVLGLICEVSLKVVPRPAASCTLVRRVDEGGALSFLGTLHGRPVPLTASAWFDGTLYLRLGGSVPAVEEGCDLLGGTRLDDAAADAWWSGLRDQSHPFFAAPGADLWRVSVPPTAPAVALGDGAPLIEWGGALRWLRTDRPAVDVRARAAALGGHATRFRTAATARDAFTPLPEPLARLHRELKRAFDPDHLFNPGRLYPEL